MGEKWTDGKRHASMNYDFYMTHADKERQTARPTDRERTDSKIYTNYSKSHKNRGILNF